MNQASTSQAHDLACLGNLVLDIFGAPIDTFPEEGGGAYFDTLEMHGGGCAHNTGVAGSRLGLDVAVLGKVGRDPMGDALVASLEANHVDTSGVRRSEGEHTGFSFVMVPESGNRRYYHTYGANRTYGPNEVWREAIASAKAFHVAGASLLPALDGAPTVELLRFARDHGVLTSLDPVVKEGIADVILPCLPHLDVFLPNSDESVHITGLSDPRDQLQFYLDRGARVVGIKMGEKGVLISDGTERLRVGVYDVPVADTCGAGDAFVAGYIYGTLQGWSMRKATQFASATSAFCVQSIGTTSAIPTAEDVLEFINNKETVCH